MLAAVSRRPTRIFDIHSYVNLCACFSALAGVVRQHASKQAVGVRECGSGSVGVGVWECGMWAFGCLGEGARRGGESAGQLVDDGGASAGQWLCGGGCLGISRFIPGTIPLQMYVIAAV